MVRALVCKSAGASTRRGRVRIGATLALAAGLLPGGATSLAAAEDTPRLRFGHMTVEDGLSNPWVHAIVRDSRGFLWIGTQDGLNRYDGARFKIYRRDPSDPTSLPSSVAGVLFEDSQKRLWVGSGWGNAGLALYDRERDQFQRLVPRPGAAHGNDVRTMIEDRNGQLWLGTDNGIARLDPAHGTITPYPLLPDAREGTPEAVVLALLEDSSGRLWVGASGLLRFDRERGVYERWSGRGAPGSSILETVQISDLYEERPDVLWVATMGHGLVRLDAATGRETRFMPDKNDPHSIAHSLVRRLVADGEGRLYVGTDQGGLDVLDLRSLTFSHHLPDLGDPNSLGSASIWSIYRDDQEIVWIGTYNAGVDRISPFAQGFGQISPRRSDLSAAHVSAVLEDHRGNLWIGTDGGGLNELNRATGRMTHYRHDPENDATIGSDAVWALFEDRTHALWVGCWNGGLSRLDPSSGRVRRFLHDPEDPASIASDHVWKVLELSTGELLVVTHAGADLFDRKTETFSRLAQRYPEAESGVLYSAAEDLAGGLWLVGIGPATRIDKRTGAVERYRNNPQEPEIAGTAWAQAILVDTAGNVWLGTDAGLQCVLPGTREVRRYTTADGLSSNAVSSLAEDLAGNLWIGTSHGLTKLEGATRAPDPPTFLRFDRHDGLAGNELARNAAFRGRAGELYFGGSGGLTFFEPERVRTNTHVPPVVLTGLRLFNEPAEIGVPRSPLRIAAAETKELHLSYKHAMVTFEFAALDLALPQKNRYAYKLEGFDREWNQVGTQRSATYTNLPPGSFVLRVRGSNNDGVWNEEGLSLKVRVTPPFWKTWWFITGIVALLAGAIVAAHRLRVRHYLRIERELQRRVDAALADVKTLRGLLPICAWCKNVRDDGGYWSRIDEYVSRHSQAEFSHGICPDCAQRFRNEALGSTAPSR